MSHMLLHIHRNQLFYSSIGLVFILMRLFVNLSFKNFVVFDLVSLIVITLLFWAFVMHPVYWPAQTKRDLVVKVLYFAIITLNVIDIIFILSSFFI